MPITLKAARINANRTQVEAAEYLEVTKNTMSNYENYKTPISIDKAQKLAEYYNTSIDNIIWSE